MGTILGFTVLVLAFLVAIGRVFGKKQSANHTSNKSVKLGRLVLAAVLVLVIVGVLAFVQSGG